MAPEIEFKPYLSYYRYVIPKSWENLAIGWVSVGLSPCPVTVTTGIITFLVGNPNLNLHFPVLLGGGDNPSYQQPRLLLHRFFLYLHRQVQGRFGQDAQGISEVTY